MDENVNPIDCSDSPFRSNPTLPAGFDDDDELLNADIITGTAFSKQWLFTVLMKLIQEVDKQNEPGNDDSEFGVDDVVVFMHEFKSVELLSAVIVKSRAPRVTEICVGILGNLSCNPTVCSEMSTNPEFINMVLLLLENPDGLCLVQTVRLLYCCLQSEEHYLPWVAAIKDHEANILELVKFIMASSTNVELLKNVGELLNLLFYLEDELCERWSTTAMLTAMLEAVKEIGFQPCPALEVFIHNFQLMSCSQNGVLALENMSQPILEVLMKYLMFLCDEPIVPVDLKAKYLAAILSLINLIFLQGSKFDIGSFYKIDMFPKCLFKILEGLFPYIYHPVESSDSDGSKPKKKHHHHHHHHHQQPQQHSLSVVEDLASFKRYQWKKEISGCDPSLAVLYKALHSSFLRLSWLIPKKTTEDSVWCQLLHYLDTECSELHLHYLLLILQDESEDIKNPLHHLKAVSDSNGLYRLHHVVMDTVVDDD
ncbi:protein saal1-like isoform X1 [Octopus vulgaris]|uniref:Protein saal1-like isoform X1 n=1 Tax=Octopus vulgaris TaxID=6645 RepID=A0AA36BVU8_OCTVU|nr:protein saal1-like isoform X1 [Octopus vulgaris]